MSDILSSNTDVIRGQQEKDLGHPLDRKAGKAGAPSDRYKTPKEDHPHRNYVDAEGQKELDTVDPNLLELQETPKTDCG